MPSNHPTSALRVAVLLDTPVVHAWQFESLRRIADSASSELVALFVSPNATTHRGGSFLYRLFCRLDAAREPVTPDAMALVDLTTNTDQLPVLPRPDSQVNIININSKLRDKEVDVLVSFADHSMVTELADACPFGAVYFRHPYQRRADSDRVASWEVLNRQPWIVASVVRQVRGSSSPATIYRTRSGINHFSLARSRNQHLWKLAAIMPRVLRRLHLNRDNSQSQPRGTSNAVDDSDRAVSMNNLDMAIPLGRYLLWRIGQKFYRKNWLEKWHLMIGVDKAIDEVASFRTLKVPYGRFWADPFVIQRGDKYFLFFEDADVETGTGQISVMEISSTGEVQSPQTIVERPYHLSYPFILDYDDQLYLIPESADNGTVEVYRCTEFPYSWTFDRNLMTDTSAYDVTLHREGDTWWMFACTVEVDGASCWDELSLYYADHPLSANWTPHPLNPVVSDVCNARPAGRLFRRNGELFRPAQNSSHRYGYGLNINRVLELSKTGYREEITNALEPDWDPAVKALHTYSHCGALTVVDAIRRARKK